MFSPNSDRLVFWAHIEFSYDKGSRHHGEFAGGFVYCFVQGADARDALDQLQIEFASKSMGLLFVEFVSLYADVNWPTEEDQDHFDSMAKLASSSEEVIFDSFDVYERR